MNYPSVEGEPDLLHDGWVGLVGVQLLLFRLEFGLGHSLCWRRICWRIVVRVDDHDGIVVGSIDLLRWRLFGGRRGLLQLSPSPPDHADTCVVRIQQDCGAIGRFDGVNFGFVDALRELIAVQIRQILPLISNI